LALTILYKKTAERAEFLSLKLNDLLGKEHTVRGGIRDLELRLEAIEHGQKEIIQLLHENMSLSPRSARLGRWSTNNEDQNQSQTMIEGQQQRSDSLHSLPELATNRNRWRPARHQREYTTITDQIAIVRPVQQRSTVLDKDRSRPSQPLLLNVALPFRNRNESVSVSTTEDLAEMLHDLEVVSPSSSLSMCSRSPVPRSEF